jgi:hypothetical protein
MCMFWRLCLSGLILFGLCSGLVCLAHARIHFKGAAPPAIFGHRKKGKGCRDFSQQPLFMPATWPSVVLGLGTRDPQIGIHQVDGQAEAGRDLGDSLPLVMKLIDLLRFGELDGIGCVVCGWLRLARGGGICVRFGCVWRRKRAGE